MEQRKAKRTTRPRLKNIQTVANKNGVRGKNKTKKMKLKPIIIVDYIFLISLALSVIFGMQTNSAFLLPFTITLVITLVCMGIILVNSIYSKIKKKFRKVEK